jgi:hypothetical protein
MHYRKIYEQHYGPIPKGHHIHHKDMNHANDDPLNLEALHPDAHAQKHGFLNNFIMAQATATELSISRNRGNQYNNGRKHSTEQNQRHADFMKGKRYKFGHRGHKITLEQSLAQSIRQTGGKHKPRTLEQNRANSARQIGIAAVPSVLVICQHCHKTGASRGMKRWHFQNCARNPGNHK